MSMRAYKQVARSWLGSSSHASRTSFVSNEQVEETEELSLAEKCRIAMTATQSQTWCSQASRDPEQGDQGPAKRHRRF